jgi:DNA-binding XRE family transcriptional regulator
MFTLIDMLKNKAKLRATEVAKLLGVSKQAVSTWYAGKREPHNQVEARMSRLVDAVNAGVQSGDFPVPATVEYSERWNYINRTIVKHHRALMETREAK